MDELDLELLLLLLVFGTFFSHIDSQLNNLVSYITAHLLSLQRIKV